MKWLDEWQNRYPQYTFNDEVMRERKKRDRGLLKAARVKIKKQICIPCTNTLPKYLRGFDSFHFWANDKSTKQ